MTTRNPTRLMTCLLLLAAPGWAVAQTVGPPPVEPEEASAPGDAVVEQSAHEVAEEVTDEPAKGRFSGLVFGDVFWMASNHLKEDVQGSAGLWFRRVYLTYDHGFSDQFDARVRLEMNSPGDFVTAATLEPFVKDLYLRWRGANTSVLLGMSPAPALARLESLWGYRSVERTPLDLHRWVGSRDTGIAVKGSLGGSGKLKYHALAGNGSGTQSETNPGKSIYGALSYDFTDRFFVEAYADYNAIDDQNNRYTWQVIAGYDTGRTQLGGQYAVQTRRRDDGSDSNRLSLASFLAVHRLSDRLRLLARVDRMFEPDPLGPDIAYLPFNGDARSMLVIVGIDYELAQGVQLIPNFEYVAYDSVDDTPDPDDDLMLRVTFFWRWG